MPKKCISNNEKTEILMIAIIFLKMPQAKKALRKRKSECTIHRIHCYKAQANLKKKIQL